MLTKRSTCNNDFGCEVPLVPTEGNWRTWIAGGHQSLLGGGEMLVVIARGILRSS